MKEQILNHLKQTLFTTLQEAKTSYESALAHSRSDDMKSEGKYDTRAIEAGYLTSAKKQRLDQLDMEYKRLQEISDQKCDKAILGALVTVECEDKTTHYFLCCACGGEVLDIDGIKINVITTTSPLGREILGQEEGDEFELETARGTKSYCIEQIQ
ncbi:MAG: GreA/GreB family elongation factor [Bacteriovoracaceae bacterium]|nr:GreA/GreB family elongation factor [Bacteriovoracaceae bacterium]